MTSYKNCTGTSPDVEIGAGRVRIVGEDAATLKILKQDDSKGELIVGTLSVDSISGATLQHLGHTLIDSLDSDSGTDLLSAKQGKVLKGYIDAINTLLASDETSLDTLQEIVDFIENNKDLIDELAISNISGLETALDQKVAKAGSTMHGELVMQGADVDMIQGAKLKFTAGGLSADLFINSSNYLESSRDIYAANHIHVENNITVGGTVDGRDIAAMGSRQDAEAMRSATINKNSGENDIGEPLSAGVLVGELFAMVTEVFDNNAYIEIGTASEKDKLCTLEAVDLAVLQKKIHLSPVVYFTSGEQIQYKVYNGGSTGQVKVYFKPLM